MRKKIIAGNWKMNKTPSEAVAFVNKLKVSVDSKKADVVFCVPFVSLACAADALKGTGIAIGAQNMHYEDSGAYTGEISAAMLADMGIAYVIIGHSERRQYFGETDVSVNKKALKALAAGLIPIVCVGETLEQREQGITADLLRLQTRVALQSVSVADAKKLVIAYEPVWAIGTGKTATKEQADEACGVIRQLVRELYGAETAEAVRIQYGGSVKAGNAKELFAMPNIDGGLVGGASITEEFEGIVNYE